MTRTKQMPSIQPRRRPDTLTPEMADFAASGSVGEGKKEKAAPAPAASKKERVKPPAKQTAKEQPGPSLEQQRFRTTGGDVTRSTLFIPKTAAKKLKIIAAQRGVSIHEMLMNTIAKEYPDAFQEGA